MPEPIDSILPKGPVVASGTFTVLSYNVAGLPAVLGGGTPEVTSPQISPKLNAYDLALVQEDFCHNAELTSEVTLPFRTLPEFEPQCRNRNEFGDGLRRFTNFPFTGLERVPWVVCNGSIDCKNDCLTPKGFSFARHELAPGVELDVYNVHGDSGSCRGDFAARSAQVEQLLLYLLRKSANRPVLIAGDLNLNVTRLGDEQIIDVLLETAALTDSCRAVDCGDERLDRVLIRNGADVSMSVIDWDLALEFVDEDGEDLSDHKAVTVGIRWELHDDT